MNIIRIIFVLLWTTSSLQTLSQSSAILKVEVDEIKITTSELKGRMNVLWNENTFWSRNLMLCIVDTLPGKDQAMWRLTKNQEDICELFKNYFGAEAGDALTELFYSDLNFQIEVINAAVTDSIVAKQAKERWHNSAGIIANYLHQLNPKWMIKDIKSVLNLQVDLTYETIKQRIVRDYDLEVIAFDKRIHNGNKISNMLSQGIIFQYPQKFSDLSTGIAVK